MFNRRAVSFTLLVLISCAPLLGCGEGSEGGERAAAPASSNQAAGAPAASPAAPNANAPKATEKQMARAPANYEGNLDAANCEGIVGWAWDRNQPNTPLRVDIYDGETKLDTVTASSLRQDLVAARKGNGAHGFVLPTPARLKDGKPHSIWLGFSGTDFQLNKANPLQVTCPAG